MYTIPHASVPRHLHRLRLLAPQRPSGILVGVRRQLGALPRGGRATKVDTTDSVAARPHDKAHRLAVKQRLKHQPVSFTGLQARSVGRGFARAVSRSGHRLLACSILPEHVHVVVVADRLKSRAVLGHLKREAALALKVETLHPFQDDYLTN